MRMVHAATSDAITAASSSNHRANTQTGPQHAGDRGQVEHPDTRSKAVSYGIARDSTRVGPSTIAALSQR